MKGRIINHDTSGFQLSEYAEYYKIGSVHEIIDCDTFKNNRYVGSSCKDFPHHHIKNSLEHNSCWWYILDGSFVFVGVLKERLAMWKGE